ncbi:4-(cytidine 5'-diphospho)-2-C-methyl-D-erythritol kinase [Paraferrimonas sp. SM1919]|uniref:4-(cytidine 5'-diphospho)-2-C-methyl-D-erythritol kinase n=1 Tax=Paraferrimonas sp. SM1919 TaxID=2662263 RepID=UPI0013D74D0A|nr:4-(cytidine 5'-diphospho)-2-C-methyl-D-erythritol kinase [Paraferrimonas sp. SM1919]
MSILNNWPAPAKLNLFLNINGRRQDNYHELQTLFQFIDICDYLDFESRHDGKIMLLTDFDEVAHDDNLIVKAARILQQHTRTKLGANIWIKKKLPMGGGIGGGSSNAATTLVALNHLWQTGVSQEQLADLGLALGADVPIFVRGHAAYAEGVGEKFTDANPEEYWYLVIVPQTHVSTAAVFSHPHLTRDSAKIDVSSLPRSKFKNDCQSLVTKLYPQVAKALDWLLKYAPSRMTGTGACVFAEFSSEEEAVKVYQQLPKEFHGFLSRGCNRSPLLEKLTQDS